MGLLVTKNFRILQGEEELCFKIGREGKVQLNHDELSDIDFDSYYITTSRDSIVYSMVLPIQVEENLKTVVNSFVEEKVPFDSDYKVDFAYSKDKGKLKILISVIKNDVYSDIKNLCYEKSEQMSGIVPVQVLYFAFAVERGIKDGLCLFLEKEGCVCFFMENGFPLNFVRIKLGKQFIPAVTRMVASLRKDFDLCDKHFFGNEENIDADLSTFKMYSQEFCFIDSILCYLKNKSVPNLNFLPLKERKVSRKIWKYVFMTVGLLLSCYYVVNFGMDYKKLKNEVTKYEIKLKKEKIVAMQLGKLVEKIDSAQTELNLLKKYDKQKRKVMLALSEITKLAPDDTYATAIKINDRNNQVEITGKSKNVYGLQRSLSKSKYLKDWKKPGTVRKDKGGYDTFVMRGKIVF